MYYAIISQISHTGYNKKHNTDLMQLLIKVHVTYSSAAFLINVDKCDDLQGNQYRLI